MNWLMSSTFWISLYLVVAIFHLWVFVKIVDSDMDEDCKFIRRSRLEGKILAMISFILMSLIWPVIWVTSFSGKK